MVITSRRSFGTLALLSALMLLDKQTYGLTNLVPIEPATVGGSASFTSSMSGNYCNDEQMTTYCKVNPGSDGDGYIQFDMGA